MDSAQDFSRIGCASLLEAFGKVPKSASGEILEGSGQHFGLGTFLGQKMVPEKIVLWRNGFVVGF